jgi:lysozyme family protein
VEANFELAMKDTRAYEGGNYDGRDPDDPNVTSRGVIQKTYDDWRSRHTLPTQHVYNMTEEEAVAIYKEFWDAAHCQELPHAVAVACFDAAINSGPKRAIKLFQLSSGFVGPDVDGIWGPKTAAAAYRARQDERASAQRLSTERLAWYVSIYHEPSQMNEFKSWINRVVEFNRKYLT